MKKQLLFILLLCFSGVLMAQQVKAKPKTTQTKSMTSEDQMDFLAEKKAPQYNGGKQLMFKFINQNMSYPDDAREKGIEGDVELKFMVGADGTISNVQVVKGVYPSIDAEAVRVVKSMPPWIPGQNGAVKVCMKSSLIIGFHLAAK